MKKAKNISNISEINFKKRMTDMINQKEEFKENVEDIHVYIAQGNAKTGLAVPSVSLIPVYNCGNCKQCSRLCYDLRNDCCYKGCRDKRAVNVAILEEDRDRYFAEIDDAVKTLRFFRWHIGGDIIDYDYFVRMCKIAEDNIHCTMLVFTKMFDVVNEYLDKGNVIPENLRVIFSGWVGLEMDNKHNLPTSHPLFADGSTTAHDGAKLCTGNCTECAKAGTMCWVMDKGEEVVFPAH